MLECRSAKDPSGSVLLLKNCVWMSYEKSLFREPCVCVCVYIYMYIHRCIKKFRDLFHRPPTDGSTWISALCLGAGNVATQYAEWLRGVSIGSCTTRVFVTTCAFTFAIWAWTWNWSREQTSNSAWNSANLERRLLKWYDVRMEMRPWVARGVSSGTRASREAEHHSKTTRGHKVKVQWSRYRPGVAQKVGRGIALLYHDHGTRRGWGVSSTPRPDFIPG